MTDEERYERGQEIVRDVEREFAGRPMAEMVEEVRARVEKLMMTEGGSYCAYLMRPVERTTNPEPLTTASRAFPDSFYYRPEPAPPDRSDLRVQVYESPVQQWITPTENFGKRSQDVWVAPGAPMSARSQEGELCQCGHLWEEHAPACFYLIQGCGCEGFLKVPQGVVEGG